MAAMSSNRLWGSIAPHVRDALAGDPRTTIPRHLLNTKPSYAVEVMPGEVGGKDIIWRYNSIQHLRNITGSVCEPIMRQQLGVNADNEPVYLMVIKYPPAATQGVNNHNSKKLLQIIRDIYNYTPATAQDRFKYVSGSSLIPVQPNKSWPTFFADVLKYLCRQQANTGEGVPEIINDFIEFTVPRLIKDRDNTPRILHGNLASENILTTTGSDRQVFLTNPISLVGPIELDLAIFNSKHLFPEPREYIGIGYRQELGVEGKELEDVMCLYAIYHHLLFAWRYPKGEKAARCQEQ
jgi:fructosamine-3-kinase